MSEVNVVKVFQGNIIHSTEENEVDIILKGLVGVTKEGKIAFVEPEIQRDSVLSTFNVNPKNITQLTKSQFLMPGLIDSLALASPMANMGVGNNLSTIDWLRLHVFPMEMKFVDPSYATLHYTKAVKNSLRCGTTTGVYHCPIYLPASLALLRVVGYQHEICRDGSFQHSTDKYGQSAFIGKSCVTSNTFIPEYLENYDTSINETTNLFKVRRGDKLNPRYQKTSWAIFRSQRIHPIVTPRSAPYCTLALMKELGATALKFDCPVQTSASESLHENSLVKDLFPLHSSYTDVYNQCGLLTRKTLLAHAIYLNENELDLLHVKNVSVIHCPQSDLARGYGMMNARKYLKMGVNVCLGTDAGSGPSCSMFDVMKRAINVSQAVECTRPMDPTEPKLHHAPLNYCDALKMATLNGAKALGIDEVVGNFIPGKFFDAIVVDMDGKKTNVYRTDDDPFDVAACKFFLSGSETNIKDVYVSGKLVYSNRPEFQFD